MPTCIDPTRLELKPKRQFLLCNYILSKPNENFFEKNKPYMADNETEFYLKHSILRRERKPGKEGFRLEVIGTKIGEGSFGKIYEIANTLGLNNSQLTETNKGKHRVLKKQLCNDKTSQLIETEDKITSVIPHLHAKKTIFNEDQAYTVIKKMPGENLEKFNKKKIPTEHKLQLCLALIQALKTQVHDKDVVHRDIKPANAMVYFNPYDTIPEVNIIDFGFAKTDKCNDVGKIVGSPLYMAPELIIRQGSSKKSDLYSLGKVFLGLFSKNFLVRTSVIKGLVNKLINNNLSKQEIKKIISFGLENNDLFQEDPNLADKHQRQIERLIKEMCSFDPEKRPSSDLVIATLTSILKERKLYANLVHLKQLYPIYSILSNYPSLFNIKKIDIESDEKKINHNLNIFFSGKKNIKAIENDINQIMKTWDLIKKRNNSVVFSKIFTILEQCVNTDNDEEKKVKYDPLVTLKKIIRKKIIAYVKTHMHDLINRRDGKLENMIHLVDILKESHTNQIFREKIMEWKSNIKSNEFALFLIDIKAIRLIRVNNYENCFFQKRENLSKLPSLELDNRRVRLST